MTWEEAKQKGLEARVEVLLKNESPVFLARMQSGFASLGDSQLLPGYSVLVAYPMVASLEDLDLQHRLIFLRDMSLLGQAVVQVCKPLRMNYSIYGNHDPFLHAHVRARYAWEKDEYRKAPYDSYPPEACNNPEVAFGSGNYEALRLTLAARLQELMREYARASSGEHISNS